MRKRGGGGRKEGCCSCWEEEERGMNHGLGRGDYIDIVPVEVGIKVHYMGWDVW